MAFCKACGQDAGDASFCPKCGAAQGAPAGGAQGAAVASAASSAADFPTAGIDENVAGLLCYIFWWVSGLIFLLIDKRPFVRFHAAQSIVVFGGLHVLNIVVGIFFFRVGFMMMGGYGAFGLGSALYGLISLAAFILWILLMVKAYQHEKFEVPIAAGIAKSFSGN